MKLGKPNDYIMVNHLKCHLQRPTFTLMLHQRHTMIFEKIMNSTVYKVMCITLLKPYVDVSSYFRGHKVLTYLVGPDEQTSVAYKLWNKTAEKSMHNASCGTTVVKIDVHYAPSFTIKREPQFGIPIIEGMTVMLGKQMEYFCVKAKIKWEEIKSFSFFGSILLLNFLLNIRL